MPENIKSSGIFIAFFIALFSIKIVSSQEQLGLHLEKYAGINATAINPANSFLTRHKWDVNILSSGLFFDNDYGFLRNTNTLELLRHVNNISFEYDSSAVVTTNYPPGTFLLDFFRGKKQRYFSLVSNTMGPSFTIKIDDKNSLGFITAHRIFANISKIPDELSFYVFYNKPYYQPFSITYFYSGMISWKEFGINYVRKATGDQAIALFGGTVKYLSGTGAMFFDNEKTFHIQQMPNDSIAALKRLHLRYGFTGINTNLKDFIFDNYGNGISLDLGTTVIFGESVEDYHFALGVSLLDIGFINFNKDSKEYRIDGDTFTVIDLNDFNDFKNLSQIDSIRIIMDEWHADFNGNTSTKDNFKMRLPAALSIQFDYRFSTLFHARCLLVQRLISKGNQASRNNLFAVLPSVEHRWFSAAMPLVVYDWKDVRIGLSVRFAYLTLGSDNILTVLAKQKHYTGTDVYMGLKFNPFPVKHRVNLNKHIKCYEF